MHIFGNNNGTNFIHRFIDLHWPPLASISSINCFVNLVKENLGCFLPRTISICLYFVQSRLYKRFNFEVEVSLGKFSKQVCITSQSGRPTREIWRKKKELKKSFLEAQVCIPYLTQTDISYQCQLYFLHFHICISIANIWTEKQCPWVEWDVINHDFEPRSYHSSATAPITLSQGKICLRLRIQSLHHRHHWRKFFW